MSEWLKDAGLGVGATLCAAIVYFAAHFLSIMPADRNREQMAGMAQWSNEVSKVRIEADAVKRERDRLKEEKAREHQEFRVVTSNNDEEARGQVVALSNQLASTRQDLASAREALALAEKRLSELDPRRRPLVSASATVTLLVNSKDMLSSRYLTSPACVGFGRRDEALLLVKSPESAVAYMSANERQVSASLHEIGGRAVGRPIVELTNAEYIQIEFTQIATNQLTKGGSVVYVLNNEIRLPFEIPPPMPNWQAKIFIPWIRERLLEILTPP